MKKNSIHNLNSKPFVFLLFLLAMACSHHDPLPAPEPGSITVHLQDSLLTPENTSVTGTTQNVPTGKEVTITFTDAGNNRITEKTAVQSTGSYSKDEIDLSGLADGQITVKASVADAGGDVVTATKTVTKSPKAVVYNYTSEYPYNLNVIYFVTSDRDTNTDYHKRLSEIMLQGQDFYGQWMKYWGYGNRTFGLLKDAAKGRVKIEVVRGKYASDYYPYEGNGPNGEIGWQNALDEVNDYFAAHPADKAGDHNLIIFAVNEKLDLGQNMAVGVPFYGVGRNCFALDYPGMSVNSLGKGGDVGWNATKWIGGMFHELGHGLNLPHCGEQASQKTNSAFGTSIMGYGNSTYGISPTFLTHSSCAILNNCQVFSKVEKTFYGSVTAKIETLHASYNAGTGAIDVSGTFSSSVQVNNITYYNRPTNNDGGYTAVTWVGRPVNSDSFSMSMPVSEFNDKGNQEYEFDLILNHDDGNSSWFRYSYTFQNNIPVIDFGDKEDYAKTNWEVTGFSSEETNTSYPGQAVRIIDGDINTYWHSNWSCECGNTFPHWLSVDMQSTRDIAGFGIWQRQDSPISKDFEIQASNDGSTWETVVTGILQQSTGRQNFSLAERKTFRYFKIIINSAYGADEQMASIAEISAYK